jgi:hypothetical protein
VVATQHHEEAVDFLDSRDPRRFTLQYKVMSEQGTPSLASDHVTGMKRPRWFLAYAVFLPSFTLVLELTTRACGSTMFDPLATWMHVVLVALVPVANFATHLVVNKGLVVPFKVLGLIRGAAWISSCIYVAAIGWLNAIALILLPFSMFLLPTGSFLAPLVVLATLGPLTGFVGLLRSGSKLRARDKTKTDDLLKRGKWLAIGASLAAITLIAVEAPFVITLKSLPSSSSAISDSWGRAPAVSPSSVSPEAIQRLRNWGSESALRELCYRGGNIGSQLSVGTWLLSGESLGPLGSWERENISIQTDTARECYYRVYGRAFSEAPPARTTMVPMFGESRRGGNGNITEGWVWDGDVGGDDVGARLRGLAMHSSRMDWHLDAPSQLAYGEWTLEFRNKHANAQEARCQMMLPPGGCVSRLTLWVNGEEREAAFGSKAAVKAAYKQVVVVERRDPVLVNMVGPDRIMVQCFPVPAGGVMKIRLGITAPLDGVARGALVMPQIIERNFSIPSDVIHTVWAQGSQAFQTGIKAVTSRPDGNHHAWQGSVSEPDLMKMRIRFAEAPSLSGTVWAEDRFADSDKKFLSRTSATTKMPGAKSLVIAIDASAGLAEYADQISSVVKKLGSSVTNIIVSTDEGFEEVKVDAIRKSLFIGGRDSSPALSRAAELARVTDSPVVWLHGSQPLSLPESASLEQLLERAAKPPRFITIGLREGPNRLLEKLYKHASVESIGRVGDSNGDLEKLLIGLSTEIATTTHHYQRAPVAPPEVSALKVWDQLARYAVHEEVLAGFKGTARAEKQLADLAVRYQLVTPVSGAVVLETQQQYDRAGLKPVDSNTTPQIPNGSVPEPSRLMLMLIGTVALILRRQRPGF